MSEKTVRRRIWNGSIKADQVPGIWGIEYRITDLGGKALEKGVRGREELPENGDSLTEGPGGVRPLATAKVDGVPGNGITGSNYSSTKTGEARDISMDIPVVKSTGDPMDKALDMIKSLQMENERLAGQLGFMQAQLMEAETKIKLLTAPAGRSNWLKRLFFRNSN
ncbi:MAG: hypothetical protein U1D67_00905 [Dehalococcoidia bacterium]|nr:hypothetical protein [Dehalococcoidia bacterium]MDZ4245659.1 hypothetical protein [Dehalococcoidia bacterium]